MAHEETALRTVLEIGAWSLASAGAAVLLLALVAELLRRSRAASPIVALADRLLPTTSRRVAVALVTLVSTVGALSMPASAGADDHRTRSWLEADDHSTTTTTPSPPRPTSTTTAAAIATSAPVAAPPVSTVLRGDATPTPSGAAGSPAVA